MKAWVRCRDAPGPNTGNRPAPWLAQDPQPHRGEHGFQLGPGVELPAEVADVIAHGVRADAKLVGYLPGSPAQGHQPQDFQFSWRQPDRLKRRRRFDRMVGNDMGSPIAEFTPHCC